MPARRVSDSMATPHAGRARARARAIARARSRLPLWLFSLIVVAGAVLAMTLIGPRAATTEIPATLQVGSQAAPSIPSSATSTIPAHPTGSTSTTIVPATTPRTRVVQPQETVTREDNSKESDSSADGSSGVTSTTSSTLAPASTGN